MTDKPSAPPDEDTNTASDTTAGTSHLNDDPDLDRVRRKWQLASCAHFLEVFREVLPLRTISVDTFEDLTPDLLERAIVNPGLNTQACLALRDVIMALLVALEEATLKNVTDSWFQTLTIIVESRPAMFQDCFDSSTPLGNGMLSTSSIGISPVSTNGTSASHSNTNGIDAASTGAAVNPKSMLGLFSDGLHFLASATWATRLGLLLSLCDIAAEESNTIRAAIRDAEISRPEMVVMPTMPQSSESANARCAPTSSSSSSSVAASKSTNTADANGESSSVALPTSMQLVSPLEERGIRLQPIGRCSRKRSFYGVGKTRIYSGYRRKGSGALVVECSDSSSMLRLVSALESTKKARDIHLAAIVREKYLAPVLKIEEAKRKKLERKRQEEIERLENRRRNSHRPRRKKAAYA